MLLLGIGAVIWVRHLMPDVELTEQRHLMGSDPKDRAAFKETFEEGAEASQFVKRPLVRRSADRRDGAARRWRRSSCCATSARCRARAWTTRSGARACGCWCTAPAGRSRRPSSARPAASSASAPRATWTTTTRWPRPRSSSSSSGPASCQSRRPDHAVPNKVVANWTVDNIVAYSKICTHVGCPAALYEQTTHHILCPCHQSTFDAAAGRQGHLRPGYQAAAAAADRRRLAGLPHRDGRLQ